MAERQVMITVDRQNGWRVVHPTPLSMGALIFIILTVPLTGIMIVAGTVELVEHDDVGPFFGALGISAFLLTTEYFGIFSYFVAFNETSVAHGRRRRNPQQVIARADVAHVKWYLPDRHGGAQLHDQDCAVLMTFESFIAKKQAASIAKQLGVPFQ